MVGRCFAKFATLRPGYSVAPGPEMLVHFVTDEPAKIPAIRAMLEPRYRVLPRLLGNDGAKAGANGVLMVDADLREMVRVDEAEGTLFFWRAAASRDGIPTNSACTAFSSTARECHC